MLQNERRILGCLLSLVVAAGTVGCGDSTGVGGPQNVALNFRVTSSSALQLIRASGPALASGPSTVAGDPMTITGTNGTLTIEEIRLIVAEVELEGEDDGCDDLVPEVDDCADFEAPPRFIDLPLDGQPIEAFVGLIPPGTYTELEFEIEDLEDDEDDPELASAITVLRADILAEIPDWPSKASGMVVGTFDSPSSGVVRFRVFLEAEIEIELDLIPNLVVGADGSASVDLTIDVRPDLWFLRPDGSVIPLHLFDYDLTGLLLEFELEMENGFTEIEIES